MLQSNMCSFITLKHKRERPTPLSSIFLPLYLFFFIKESIQLCLQLQSVRVYDGRAKAWWQELCGV